MSFHSSANHSLPLATAFLPLAVRCLSSPPGAIVFTSYVLANIVLLCPLCIFIVCLGLQRWRQRRSSSSSSSSTAMSHFDTFAYHMVAMELLGTSGGVVCVSSIFGGNGAALVFGCILFIFTWYGQTFLHVTTCVERYLAVVHPVAYRTLRTGRWIRIRNAAMGCVWLLSFAGTSLTLVGALGSVTTIVMLALSLLVVSFCSLAVLCALIGPGPGEQGGKRPRVDQSKRRAFHTILVILSVLVLRFVWNLVWTAITLSGRRRECAAQICDVWFILPSSLVLPVLFLQKEGKLTCRHGNNQ